MEEEIRDIMRQRGRDPDERFSELMEGDERDIEQLVEDVQDSPGQRIMKQITALYTTLEIVNKNHEEVTKSRDWYIEQGFDLWKVENRNELEDFQREYLRRLHNYSTSVHSLIEHAYTILDRYEESKPELKDGYFEEISERDLGTKVDLLKQLRHYTQKRELPPVAASLHSERISREEGHETEFRLILKKEEMMDWDGWSPNVRERLQEWDDEIEITRLGEEYQRELNEFFKWFRTFVLRVFYDEIEDYAVAVALLNDHHSK